MRASSRASPWRAPSIARAVLALVQHLLVMAVGLLGVVAENRQHARRLLAREHVAAALAVRDRLRRQMLGRRHVELLVQDRIARRVLVDVGGAMADPLARHEDRQLHVVLDLAHLEGRGVPVAHQIVDEPLVLRHLLRATAVGDARRLHHRRIVAHIVDDAHEAVVEHGQRPIEQFFERRHGRAPGRLRRLPLRLDLGFLLGGQAHPCSPFRRCRGAASRGAL